MRIRGDIETKPVAINIQSSGIAEEEQIFYTEDDNETEEQIWERKKQSRNNTPTDQPKIVIDSMLVNIPTTHEDINEKLQKTVQIVVEQSKDPLLLQIKAKLQNQEYSEEILAQDVRYRHYNSNMDRIFLKDEVLTRLYYDETGQINIPFDYVYTATHDPFAGLTANTAEGETFFEANEEGVFYRNEPLVTEERVREIFREEYYNILREDLDNLG